MIYGKISITGPDLYPKKIEKFDDRFGRQFLHFLQKNPRIIIFGIFFILHNNKYSVHNNKKNYF